MVSGPRDENQPAAAPPEAVTTARSEFLQSLGRRLEFIRNLLESVGKDPDAGERQASAQRRLHALKAAAQVLGFEGLGSALTEIEAQVSVPLDSAAAEALVRRLELLPGLVLSSGGQFRSDQSGQFRAVQAKSASYPMHALVFAAPPLAESLRSELAFSSGQALECERTESLMRARSIALEQAPDVILVDYDRPNAKELLELLLNDPEVEVAPIVVVGSFDSPEAASGLARLGVNRVLPKPVSPSTLRATVLDVFGTSALKPSQARGFGELSVEKLAQRVASELEEGLRGTVDPATMQRLVNLGDGAEVLAAVWGAIARIREVVTVRSGGQVRFDPRGPEGAIHVAPWITGERRAGDRAAGGRMGDDVSLDGRLVLVADDDPVVTWFISGLLRSAGARVMEAHDGKRALELCQRHWPDALVSDILMPELDGFRLCRAIKGDIAVRDVPVILLSWKEDMLQRVRELGAGADGYLKKEADGSLVVQRLREVLRPRSRVEARLATSGEVKGRLGDITPRLVLQLACKRQQNVQVNVRDAVYLYEVEVRRGKPVSATRTSDDGVSARGPAVIAALLGVSAGRFAVRPSEAETPRDFDHDLYGVLEEPIRVARGARAALGGGRLFEVDQVALDPAVLDAYMRATPESARDIARRVAQGVPVRQLVSEGMDVSLIEAVLLDLAQHGGVRAIVTKADGDLLPRAALAMQGVTATGEPPPVMEASAPPQFTLSIEPSSLPPEVDLEPVLDVSDVPLLGCAPLASAVPLASAAALSSSALMPSVAPVTSAPSSAPPIAGTDHPAESTDPDDPALSREDEAEIADVLLGLSEHPPAAEAVVAEASAAGHDQEAARSAAPRASDERADALVGDDAEELPPVRKLAFGPAPTLLSATQEASAALALAAAAEGAAAEGAAAEVAADAEAEADASRAEAAEADASLAEAAEADASRAEAAEADASLAEAEPPELAEAEALLAESTESAKPAEAEALLAEAADSEAAPVVAALAEQPSADVSSAPSVAEALAEESFIDASSEQSFADVLAEESADDAAWDEIARPAQQLAPTEGSPQLVPRPILDLSRADGTQPLGVETAQRPSAAAGKTSAAESAPKAEPTQAEPQRALGLTAPLPPIRELEGAVEQSPGASGSQGTDAASASKGTSERFSDPSRSLRSDLMRGLTKRAPVEGPSPEIKAIVMPKADLKSTLPGVGGTGGKAKAEAREVTAPLPPTKAIDFGSDAPVTQASAAQHASSAERSEAPSAQRSEAPSAEAPSAEAPSAEAPSAEAPSAELSEAPSAELSEAPSAEAPSAAVPELEPVHTGIPSEGLPVVRAATGVATQIGLGARDVKPPARLESGPQDNVGELQALARAASTPAPEVTLQAEATVDAKTEPPAKKPETKPEVPSVEAPEEPSAAQTTGHGVASVGKNMAATKPAEDAEVVAVAKLESKLLSQPPSKPVESKSIRYDEPRVRRIDKGPMPRLEDETPAAMASGEPPRGSRPKWLRNVGTLGAAAAAGLVAYFGVRVLMGPVTAPMGSGEVPAAAAQAAAEDPAATPAVAPKPAAKKEPVGPSITTSFGAAPTDITLDADKGLLELNTGARHSIYVDGVFVGRGPRRRVPLGIGKHDVRLKLGDAELTGEVEVQASRTTQLEVSGGDAAEPEPAKP